MDINNSVYSDKIYELYQKFLNNDQNILTQINKSFNIKKIKRLFKYDELYTEDIDIDTISQNDILTCVLRQFYIELLNIDLSDPNINFNILIHYIELLYKYGLVSYEYDLFDIIDKKYKNKSINNFIRFLIEKHLKHLEDPQEDFKIQLNYFFKYCKLQNDLLLKYQNQIDPKLLSEKQKQLVREFNRIFIRKPKDLKKLISDYF